MNTAIFYAVNSPYDTTSVINTLSESKELDITVQNNHGDTPLHQALTRKKGTHVIKSLLKANTYSLDYLDIKNHKDISVIDAAFEDNNDHVISLFNN